MAAKPLFETGLRLFYAEVAKFHLRPIKKLNFQFDPFHDNAKTVRDVLYHLSSRKIRKTSETCIIKSEVVCDRSEPLISLELHNGMNVLFKCGNLTPVDIAREFNGILEKYDVKEDKPAIKLKGALKDSRKTRR